MDPESTAWIERTAAAYRRSFAARLRSDPWHIGRVARFGARRVTSSLIPPSAPTTGVPVPPGLRPPPHNYAGYSGPWFEEMFFDRWRSAPPAGGAGYVPVFWNYLYQHIQTGRYVPGAQRRRLEEMEGVLAACGATGRALFTVTDYDHAPWEWHRFPRNVVVFGGGGDGDIPIPLLKGVLPFANPPKSIRVSFMGRRDGASGHTGVRARMFEALKGVAHFGYGHDWRAVMAGSVFTLCPRGLGRASFRMYEALSVCSIPVYVWDDRPWLPFEDEIDWGEIIVSVNVNDLATLPDLLSGMTQAEIEARRKRIAAVYADYLTPDGVFRQICRRVARLVRPEDAAVATSGRGANVAPARPGAMSAG